MKDFDKTLQCFYHTQSDMQLGTLLIVIFVLLLPIVTVYKKFDSLRKLLFFSSGRIILPKLNFSIALLTKIVAFTLFIAKFYLSLYTILYMITNHILLSLVAGIVSLGVLIVLIYIFWKLKPKWQNKIIQFSGFTISIIISFILFSFSFISLYQIIKSEINPDLIIIKVFAKDIILSAIITLISYYIGMNVSNFILSLKGRVRKVYSIIFNAMSNIPSIVLGCMSYFLISEYFPLFYSHIENSFDFIKKTLLCTLIQSLIYSPIIIRRVLKNQSITITEHFFVIFFEVNLLTNLLFFADKLGSEWIFKNYLSLLINQQSLSFVGLILFLIYLVRFIFFQMTSQKMIKVHQ